MFKCGKVKRFYLTNHGVVPYLKSFLSDKIKEFVVLFGASMNSKTAGFLCAYLGGVGSEDTHDHSEFIGYAAAEAMISVFETATHIRSSFERIDSDRPYQSTAQLSMGRFMILSILGCIKRLISLSSTLIVLLWFAHFAQCLQVWC